MAPLLHEKVARIGYTMPINMGLIDKILDIIVPHVWDIKGLTPSLHKGDWCNAHPLHYYTPI